MELISYSQSAQDLFVLSVLDRKENGKYWEIGASVPSYFNNTYLLESKFGWKGVSYEIDEEKNEYFRKVRINPVVGGDATTQDFSAVSEKYELGSVIDYLQIDVDPYWNTLKCLKNIDFKKYKFATITYEHDQCHGGDSARRESREILQSHGYTLVVPDLMDGCYSYEDWYVMEDLMPSDTWKQFVRSSYPAQKLRPELIEHLKQFDYEVNWLIDVTDQEGLKQLQSIKCS